MNNLRGPSFKRLKTVDSQLQELLAMTSALEKSDNDLLESIKIINHLLSGLSGTLEFYRFLHGFGHRTYDPNNVARLEKLILKVDRWATALIAGEPLISVKWTVPETFDAHEALSCLQILLTDLENVATTVEQIFRMKTQLTVVEDARYIAAAISKVTHARHLFLLFLSEIGPLVGDNEGALRALEEVPQSLKEIEISVGIFGYLSEADTLEPALAAQITEFASDLPKLLRTQAHETLVLLHYYEPTAVTFERIGINAQEQGRWELSGITPQEAGYWRAREISPEEAIAWKIGGITTAAEASRWISARFTPSAATPWAESGIDPLAAAAWAQEGYKPEIATAYMSKNIFLPSSIPGRS
jgi:hypothetical protein